MGTLAVVSLKGGSGKSTLATNLAAYLARRTDSITLGDLDHQQSMRVWLSRRPSAAPRIIGWVGNSVGLARPAIGTQHLVLDTPGGLHGLGLARVVMVADAILMPVGGSVFDRESSSECWNELRQHPRVVNGKCRVAAVGMRMDSRTSVEQTTAEWASSVNIPYITSLRMAQIYVRAVENGISIFDMPQNVGQVDRDQWRPLLEWAETVFFPKSNQSIELHNMQKSGKVVLLRPVDSWPRGERASRFAEQESAAVADRTSLLSRLLPGLLSRRR
jgi:chromosome partitioning protein